LTDADIARLAGFLGLSEKEFIERYTRIDVRRAGLALKDKEDGSCVFLRGRECAVQPAKPEQCLGFPNRWRFPGFEKWCRARPVEVDEAERRRLCREEAGELLSG